MPEEQTPTLRENGHPHTAQFTTRDSSEVHICCTLNQRSIVSAVSESVVSMVVSSSLN